MLFLTIEKKDHAGEDTEQVKRLSMDCKATVNIGAFSRGGYTRGDHQASAHDLGCKEKYIPCGIVDEDTAQLYVTFGSSSKTSDFIVDTLAVWWHGLSAMEQGTIERVQIKMDNGSESSGVRTQFLHRLVQFVDTIGKPIQRLDYPPYHSKYNPIERCWGVMELHWHGTQLIDGETMLEWAKRMTWKGGHPIVKLSRKVYAKGVSLSKAAMRAVEARLERNPLLPKWDILIRPAGVD
jgi:Rhodopirellula transposase DDE domain